MLGSTHAEHAPRRRHEKTKWNPHFAHCQKEPALPDGSVIVARSPSMFTVVESDDIPFRQPTCGQVGTSNPASSEDMAGSSNVGSFGILAPALIRILQISECPAFLAADNGKTPRLSVAFKSVTLRRRITALRRPISQADTRRFVRSLSQTLRSRLQHFLSLTTLSTSHDRTISSRTFSGASWNVSSSIIFSVGVGCFVFFFSVL